MNHSVKSLFKIGGRFTSIYWDKNDINCPQGELSGIEGPALLRGNITFIVEGSVKLENSASDPITMQASLRNKAGSGLSFPSSYRLTGIDLPAKLVCVQPNNGFTYKNGVTIGSLQISPGQRLPLGSLLVHGAAIGEEGRAEEGACVLSDVFAVTTCLVFIVEGSNDTNPWY